MAKKKSIQKPTVPAPTTLTMHLFGAGMTAIHRAGLGGLACSLRYIEDNASSLDEDTLPGGPWKDNLPPWDVQSDRITLDFGEPGKAREYLERLFLLSFQILRGQGLIYLPGQFMQLPSIGVLTETQLALTLTFLQHGQTRKLSEDNKNIQIDSEGDGSKLIAAEYKECQSFKHQEGWKTLVDKNGALTNKSIEVSGPLNPGAAVRHVAFTSTTKVEDPVDRMLPLLFAIVGTLALPINRGVGVLIIPDVDDLLTFQSLRPYMSPHTVRDCKIAGASDAAFQCQLRLMASKQLQSVRIPNCSAVVFCQKPWAKQLKSRVDAMDISSGDARSLRIFEEAIRNLPPRISQKNRMKNQSSVKGKGKAKGVEKKKVVTNASPEIEYFWTDSIVRPMVADNLAYGRPWYANFHDLMTKKDPISGNPKRLKLFFEKEGLKRMIDNVNWDDTGEKAIVLAVHQAIKQRLGQIASENKGKQGVMKNRMQGEFDKWRLAFSGAKTPDQFRGSICDLFGRAGINPVLKEHWVSILPWLSSPTKWQLARDLSLLALASYTGTGVKEIEPTDELSSTAE
jgi:CRISPR-associated protein Cas8a1/Csx13